MIGVVIDTPTERFSCEPLKFVFMLSIESLYPAFISNDNHCCTDPRLPGLLVILFELCHVLVCASVGRA